MVLQASPLPNAPPAAMPQDAIRAPKSAKPAGLRQQGAMRLASIVHSDHCQKPSTSQTETSKRGPH